MCESDQDRVDDDIREIRDEVRGLWPRFMEAMQMHPYNKSEIGNLQRRLKETVREKEDLEQRMIESGKFTRESLHDLQEQISALRTAGAVVDENVSILFYLAILLVTGVLGFAAKVIIGALPISPKGG